MSEFVLNTSKAWAKGQYKMDALINLSKHYRNPSGTIEIEVMEVKDFQGMRGRRVECEELVNQHILEIDGDKLKEISDMHDRMELLAEEILMNAERKEE